jgi:hypothetical protein
MLARYRIATAFFKENSSTKIARTSTLPFPSPKPGRIEPPVGLTGPMKIGYIAVVIGEKTQLVGSGRSPLAYAERTRRNALRARRALSDSL